MAVSSGPADRSRAAAGLRRLLAEVSGRLSLPREADGRPASWNFLRQLQIISLFADAYCAGNFVRATDLKPLGEGAHNSVHSFSGKGGISMAFKPMAGPHSSNHSVPGMEASANFAMWSVNELFSRHGGPSLILRVSPAAEKESGRAGISMAIAKGRTLDTHAQTDEIWSNGRFRCQETWLQLMDCVAGLIDRHVKNIFWDPVDQKISAIDSDLGFQFRPEDGADGCPATLWDGKTFSPIPIHFCIPKVIDRKMLAAIMAINGGELRKALEEVGLFPGQVDSACARLEVLKKYNYAMIGEEDWGDDGKLRAAGTTDRTSYFRCHRKEAGAVNDLFSPQNYLHNSW
jgi:hypothetical protein